MPLDDIFGQKEREEMMADLLSKRKITLSDQALLKICQDYDNLTVIEAGEDFDWKNSNGTYYQIISERHFDKAAVCLRNRELDIDKVESVAKLARLNKTYVMKGELENKIVKVPSLRELGLYAVITSGERIDLGDYKLKSSGRSREFYGYSDQGTREVGAIPASPFNQTSISADFSGPENLKVVYRMTFNDSELIGARLYLYKGNTRIRLDPSQNERLVLFMRTVGIVHDNCLDEVSCTTLDASAITAATAEKDVPKRDLDANLYDYLPGYS